LFVANLIFLTHLNAIGAAMGQFLPKNPATPHDARQVPEAIVRESGPR
jgi:hypothetical protein